MIKLLGIGVWACLVTLGASYGAIAWHRYTQGSQVEAVDEKRIEEVRTKPINVPIIADGGVQGYIIAQFIFTVDASLLEGTSVSPDVYLLDEAFKTIYAGEKVNFRKLKKQDLPTLAKQIGENVNKRLGAPIVQDVLIDQLSYVPREEARGKAG